MIRPLVFVGLALLSSTAAAQTLSQNVGTGSPYYYGHLFPSDTTHSAKADERICLVRKSSGKTECRTEYEWKQLAAKMEKAAQAKK